jgi:hypothetical protein
LGGQSKEVLLLLKELVLSQLLALGKLGYLCRDGLQTGVQVGCSHMMAVLIMVSKGALAWQSFTHGLDATIQGQSTVIDITLVLTGRPFWDLTETPSWLVRQDCCAMKAIGGVFGYLFTVGSHQMAIQQAGQS